MERKQTSLLRILHLCMDYSHRLNRVLSTLSAYAHMHRKCSRICPPNQFNLSYLYSETVPEYIMLKVCYWRTVQTYLLLCGQVKVKDQVQSTRPAWITPMKLTGNRSGQTKESTYLHKMIDLWNSLPEDARTAAGFKRD